jgi:hypothetical protein
MGGQYLRLIPIRADESVGALDLFVTQPDLVSVEVKHRQRLLEHKQMLVPPRAGQGLSDLGLILPAAVVAQSSQSVRVTLTGDNGANDPQAGLTRHV